MKTFSVATLSTAALFWLSCCLSTSAKRHLRASRHHSTNNIRPPHRNLNKKVDDGDPRIVNGWDAIPNEWPYYVRWGGCGGSLIAPKWVLTAGHCGGQSGSSLRVGAYSQNGNDGTTRYIADRVYHELYNDLKYDFLLLELNEPVYTTYAKLNDDSSVPGESGELEVIGLGRLNYRPGDKPDSLQEVIVPNHDMAYCSSAYGGFNEITMLCAGNTTYDSCVGDSGGPIMSTVGGEKVQVGLTSFGDDCAKEGKPGVYARISYAYDWIESVVCADGETQGVCGRSVQQTPPPTTPPTTPPTKIPTDSPTTVPTANPTPDPTVSPTQNPTPGPTVSPTPFPTVSPTPNPTVSPTPNPTTPAPVVIPTPEPTTAPVTPEPTRNPTQGQQPTQDTQYSPVAPTTATKQFECRDDASDFPVPNMRQGVPSCAYLAENLNKLGPICDFVDVAVACRETCGLCTLLEMFYNN